MGSVQTTVLVVIAALIPVFCVGLLLGGFMFGRRRGKSARSNRPWRLGRDLTDIGVQLSAVEAAPFERKKLLNWSEYRVFKAIEEELAASNLGYRIFAQVNLGEILKSSDDTGYRSINSKRIDILIVNRGGWPVLAVECQGAGHYQRNAAARDAVKKEALRKAGVPFMEVGTTNTDAQIRARMREKLGWPVKPRQPKRSPALARPEDQRRRLHVLPAGGAAGERHLVPGPRAGIHHMPGSAILASRKSTYVLIADGLSEPSKACALMYSGLFVRRMN